MRVRGTISKGKKHDRELFSPPHTHPHISTHALAHSFTLTSPLPTSSHLLPTRPLWLHSVLKGKQLSEHPGLKDTCQEMFSQRIRSPFLLSLLVDMYEEDVGQGKQESLGKALEVGRVTVGVISSLCHIQF